MTEFKLSYNEAQRQWSIVDSKSRPQSNVTEFLHSLETTGLSKHTQRSYGYDLLALYRWLSIKEMRISKLTNRALLGFIEYQQKLGISPCSINRRIVAIRVYYRYCTGKELQDVKGASLPGAYYKGRGRDRSLGLHGVRAPKHRLLRVKAPQLLVESLTPEQVGLFLQTLVRYRDLSIVYLMLLCGLRSQEVLNIKVRDLSFTEERVIVTGKGNKQRSLPLPVPVLNAVKRYLSVERPSLCHTSALFVTLQGKSKGQPMTTEGLRSLFRHRRKDSLLANANAHRWRHTFGTDMARTGTPLPILQRLMGHHDHRITLQYINLSMSDIAEDFKNASDLIQKRYQKK